MFQPDDRLGSLGRSVRPSATTEEVPSINYWDNYFNERTLCILGHFVPRVLNVKKKQPRK